MAKPLPPIDELFDRFYVDSTSPTGLRYARTFGGRSQENGIAGCVDTSAGLSGGYSKVWIGNDSYKTPRIILAMKTGKDCPDLEADHIDRNQRNNHPFNLRWQTRKGNVHNRKGWGKYLKGVRLDKRSTLKPWFAQIRVDGRYKSLGYYSSEQEAHQAYLNAVQIYQPS